MLLSPLARTAFALHARRLELQAGLCSSAFGEPQLPSSKELPERIGGDVHAEVTHPFETVGAALHSAEAICELMFLHLSGHSCRPADGNGLIVGAGPKRDGASGMTARQRAWFALTERHAAQLHEQGPADDLQEKPRDRDRQAAGT